MVHLSYPAPREREMLIQRVFSLDGSETRRDTLLPNMPEHFLSHKIASGSSIALACHVLSKTQRRGILEDVTNVYSTAMY